MKSLTANNTIMSGDGTVYNVVPFTWLIPAHNGQKETRIVGTVEDVMAAINRMPSATDRVALLQNASIIAADGEAAAKAVSLGDAEMPRRDADGNAAIGEWPQLQGILDHDNKHGAGGARPHGLGVSGGAATKAASLVKRAHVKLMCFLPQWNSCNGNHVNEGINYLLGVDGKPGNGPGPGNCGRVSCSYQSAIYWCNDVCFPCSFPE